MSDSLPQLNSFFSLSRDFCYLRDLSSGEFLLTNNPSGNLAIAHPAQIHYEDALNIRDKVIPRLQALADGETLELRFRLATPHGTWQLFQARESICARNSRGGPTQSMGVAQELTTAEESRASERNLQALLQTLQVGILQLDHEGSVVFVNELSETILGFPITQVIEGKRRLLDWQVVHPDGTEWLADERPLSRSLRQGESFRNVVLGIQKSGLETVWLSLNCQPISSANGQSISGVVVTFVDVTAEQKAARFQRLRLKLREYADSHSLEQILVWTIGQAEQLTSSAQGYFHLLVNEGNSIALSVGTNVQASSSRPELWREATETRVPLIHNDTNEGARAIVMPILQNGKVVAILGLGPRHFDYTSQDAELLEDFCSYLWELLQRKMSEERLLQKESGVSYSPIPMAFANMAGKVTDVNQACLEAWGFTDRSEVVGKDAVTLWSDQHKARTAAFHVLKKGHWHGDLVAKTVDGSYRLFDVSVSVFPDARGVPAGIMSTLSDVTDLRLSEHTLREQKERFTLITENLPDALIMTDPDGVIRYANRAVSELAVDSILGHQLEDFLPDSQREMVRRIRTEVLETKEFREYESSGLGSQGVDRSYHVRVAPLIHDGRTTSILYLARDVTTTNQLLEASQRNQKLESLGLLAGGIAHDFNNLLAGIFGSINLALVTKDPEKTKAHLTKALGAMERAKGLTKQLLTFAKGGEPVMAPQPLFPMIREVVEFTLSGSNVETQFVIADELPFCLIDRNQMSQVVSNLTLNAHQAMPQGGRLTVEARFVATSGLIELLFVDTGLGIPEAHLPRLFDPFFTTKSQGNGLGLATTHSIIHRHGGTIDVTSEVHKGTTFRITLPATSLVVRSETPEPVADFRGTGAILVLDDEPILSAILEGMLDEIGFASTCASTGEAAVALWNAALAAGQPYRAAILDLTIAGGMGGRETAQKLRQASPESLIFVASGYSEDPAVARPTDFGFTASLGKPFSLSELTQVLGCYLPSTT